jgi:hypothetical protein
VWWVVRLQPETRRTTAARTLARRVGFMMSSGVRLPLLAGGFSLGGGGSSAVRRKLRIGSRADAGKSPGMP